MVVGWVVVVVVLSGFCCVMPWLFLMELPEGLLLQEVVPFSLVDADLDGVDVSNVVFWHSLLDANVVLDADAVHGFRIPFLMLIPIWMLLPT